MSSPYPFQRPDVRISDEDRNGAIAALGRAFAEGRLTMDEYEDRIESITQAQTHGQVAQVFTDLPRMDGSSTVIDNSPRYTQQEVEAAYRSSKRTRLGIMALTTVGTLAAIPILTAASSWMWAMLFFVIPTVFILLYIMKIGPKSWYQPSPRQIERQRLRQIQASQALYTAEKKANDEARQAELRAQRQQLASELTNEAMGFAKRSIDKFKK